MRGSGFRARLLLVAALAGCFAVRSLQAESRRVDGERSTLTVLVYKTGLFSALADNHVITAPIATGAFSDEAPFSVEMTVRAADLKVVDPDVAASRRAEVQTRMLSREVLDVATFPEIAFTSTAIEAAGKGRWNVTGRMTIHGATRTVTFPTTFESGHYRGSFPLKQRDFGIEPISVAGGTVKVKDELKIQFDIVASDPR